MIAPPPQQLTALPDTVAPPKVVEVEPTKRSSWIFGENDDDDKEERDGENLHENPGRSLKGGYFKLQESLSLCNFLELSRGRTDTLTKANLPTNSENKRQYQFQFFIY